MIRLLEGADAMGKKKPGTLRRLFAGAGLLTAFVLLFALGETATAAPPDNVTTNANGKVGKTSAWQEDFNAGAIDTSRWVVASGEAPGYIYGKHIGYYDLSHVWVKDGYLVISLTQQIGQVDDNVVDGVISTGGLLYTKDTYGYGTYEWRVRMSSTALTTTSPGTPVSGSVSAGFNYINNSQTEIDFEFAAHMPGWLSMSNWYNTNPATGPFGRQLTYSATSVPDISTSFKTYKFVWEKRRITFYVDDVFRDSHVTNIPSAPAYFMINHWGTNTELGWGGKATVGTTRYFYIDWVKYTPPPSFGLGETLPTPQF